MTLPGERSPDRRIQKTQKLLREALFSLIHKKNYESIVVQDILDRANVGRSTFYMHFHDKDELLLSGMREMLRSVHSAAPSTAKLHERAISFGLPIFEHIHRQRPIGEAMMGSRGIVHEHLQRVVAELIANDLKKDFQRRRKATGQMPPDLVVQYVASTFILVLNWWVERRSPLAPQAANELFRGLVLPALTRALE